MFLLELNVNKQRYSFHYYIADDAASQTDVVKNNGAIIQLSTNEVATSIYNEESDQGEIQAVNEIKDNTLPDLSIEEIEMLPNEAITIIPDNTCIRPNVPAKLCTRWKKCEPGQWKRNIQKENRDQCLPYENRKGVARPAKILKVIDCSACKFKCTEKITNEERIWISEIYWGLKSFERKKDFILRNVESSVPKYRKVDTLENKQRKNSKFYYLYSNTDSTRERVCLKFFCFTLCISNTVILNAFNNQDDQGGFKGKDMRGCRSPSNKTKQEDIKFVKCHIERYPTMDSHYTRSASKRQYLDSSLSIKKMYIQYQEYCHINQMKPMSQITYW